MKRLLLVGWDAADWKIADPLVAAGEMPTLAGLIAHGVRANLATIYPPLSPMLWTSIATGKRAHKHGIHGFTEPAEDGMSIRPISNLGRTTKAFWNILNQNGKRCLVVGWWPSHPAEPIRGAMVSDRFPPAIGNDPAAAMPAGTVWPPPLQDELSELRVHPIEISGEMLRMFVPELEMVDQAKDKGLHDLAATIAETLSIHSAATHLMETQEWDVATVYYVGIDHFCHRFMRYRAGRIRPGEENAARLYSGIVANAYRWHDAMLGRLLHLAGEDCAVLLLSDHGFHSDRLLPRYIPAEAAGPAVEHRHFGMFCLRAPGVLRGKEIFGATLLDIAPTVLHLCGLPAGADMDGSVLVNAFRDGRVLAPIASWDAEAGEDGRHAAWRHYDGAAAVDALDQLVNLGYIAPPAGDQRRTVQQTLAENRYNLACACLDAGLSDRAADIFAELIAGDPEQGRYYLHLFECKFHERDFASCRRVLHEFDQAADSFASRAAEELERRRAHSPDDQLPVDGLGRPASAEIHERRQLAEKATGFAFERLVAGTRILLAEASSPAEKQTAREMLEELEPWAVDRLDLEMFLGMGFATVGDFPRALAYTRRVRRADPDHYRAIALEARIHQANGRHRECIECAIDSLALVYFQPTLHYQMGLSLRHLGEEKRAEQAFLVALSQMPGLEEAHVELAGIMRQDGRLGDAALHQARAQMLEDETRQRRRTGVRPARAAGANGTAHSREPNPPSLQRWDGLPPADRSQTVIVVSGLPRSGTSMMMQVLAAAGIPAYTDHRRAADQDNPRGYYEHERASRLHEEAGWLAEARGMAVKVVAQLLPRLPAGEQYCIVFLHRNIEEVVASQRAMLNRLGRPANGLAPDTLTRTYAGQLVRVQEWLRRAAGVQVLAVNYAQALSDPVAAVAQVAAFLGEPFDRAAAAAAIEPRLRRQVAHTI